jgi:hypothetical protein
MASRVISQLIRVSLASQVLYSFQVQTSQEDGNKNKVGSIYLSWSRTI